MKELYIKQLEQQSIYNDNIESTKINIHIPIRGTLNSRCLEINSGIKKITTSEITFSPDSFQIPHLTLYMGYVNSSEDFSQLMKVIFNYSKNLKKRSFKITAPYLKKPKLNYVFLDTLSSEEIIRMKGDLKDACGKFIKPLEWDVVAEVPHITLGYISDNFEEVQHYLNSTLIESEMIFDAIEVSFCGPRGTCLGVVRTFEIS